MEKIKMKPAKLYVIVPNKIRGYKRVTLLACDRLTSMVGFVPTEEILKTHFECERVRMEIFKEELNKNGKRDGVGSKKYIPQPLFLEVGKSTFAAMLEEIKSKAPSFKESNIALTLGGNNLPCCIISERIENVEQNKEIEND